MYHQYCCAARILPYHHGQRLSTPRALLTYTLTSCAGMLPMLQAALPRAVLQQLALLETLAAVFDDTKPA